MAVEGKAAAAARAVAARAAASSVAAPWTWSKLPTSWGGRLACKPAGGVEPRSMANDGGHWIGRREVAQVGRPCGARARISKVDQNDANM